MTPERHQKIQTVLNCRQPDLTLVMENVNKPHNLAAIARTCDAVGISDIHAVSPLEDITLTRKEGAGSNKWINTTGHSDINDAYKVLKQQGFTIISAHFSETATDFRDIDYTAPTAIVVGAELTGLSDDAVRHADMCITIPMVGMVQSLNVSVATGLILYEAQHQRARAGMYDTPRIQPDTIKKQTFQWCYPRLAEYYTRKQLAFPEMDDSGFLKQ